MKRFLIIALAVLCSLFLFGCTARAPTAQVVATTLPVYEMAVQLCAGTGISVTRLINENVSCLHDYSLQVDQTRTLEQAEYVVISGAGLEDFLELSGKAVIDASGGIHTTSADHSHHDGHSHDTTHVHEEDPHLWLSVQNAKAMALNICHGLQTAYPAYSDRFSANLLSLQEKLDALEAYAKEQLAELSCRQIITFHDGFSYMAEAFDLTVLEAVEEESGSEASAKELKSLIELVRQHKLPAIFTEINGSASAAAVISAETGVKVYALDMAMSGQSYFTAMYHNIDTLKEALG